MLLSLLAQLPFVETELFGWYEKNEQRNSSVYLLPGGSKPFFNFPNGGNILGKT